MDWLTDITFLDYMYEEDWVKNKKSGNVYQVKKFNPKKHIQPSKEEVDDAAIEDRSTSGIQLGKFGNTEEGKQFLSSLMTFSKRGVINRAQKKILEKYVRTRKKEDGTAEYELIGADKKKITSLPAELFQRLEDSTANRSKEFVDLFKKELSKEPNKGLAAEHAALDLFLQNKDDPGHLPANWGAMLESSGIDTTLPFEVIAQEQTVKGKNPFTGEEVSTKSKSDITIKQGGKALNISVKYSGGKPATVGSWHVEKIRDYFRDFLKVNSPEIDTFISALTRIQKNKYSRQMKETKEGDNEEAGLFLRTKLGRQFLTDMMTRMNQGSLLEPEHVATHVMNIGGDGKVVMHTAEEYLGLLQSLNVGTGGCGFILSWTSDKKGRQSSTRVDDTFSTVEFKEAK